MSSFVWGLKYPKFHTLVMAMPILANDLFPGVTDKKHLSDMTPPLLSMHLSYTLNNTHTHAPQKYYSKQSGQSIHNVNNRSIKAYLLELGVLTVADLPPYLDDCISGSTRVAQRGTQPLNRGQLLQALYALDDINTETVATMLNRKRIALGDKPFSPAHVATFTSALKNASQAIQHYLR